MELIIRKLFILACLLFGAHSGFSQSYLKLLNDSNKWNYLIEEMTTCGCGEIKTLSLFISGDTIISGELYNNFYCAIIRENSRDTNFVASLREDSLSQKVFVVLPNNEEKTLYSFNVKVGDTLSCDTSFWMDYAFVKYVESIESYTYSNFSGKKININQKMIRIDGSMQDMESAYDSWYEGIGSFKKLIDLQQFEDYSDVIESGNLLCFSKNEELIYQRQGWDSCEYALIMDVKNVSEKIEVYLYPNPTNDFIIIEGTNNEFHQIKIYDIKGSLLINQELNNDNKVNVKALSEGIYFIKVGNDKGESYSFKMIKE